MKRPRIEDTRTPEGHQSIGGRAVNVYKYSKLQDEYIDHLELLVKKCSINMDREKKVEVVNICIVNALRIDEEIKNVIEATSMGKLEKEAVLKSLLNLHGDVGLSLIHI